LQSRLDGGGRLRDINPYETPFKPFLPTSAYALAASRHMHQFGTTRDQLAEVAVAARNGRNSSGRMGEEAAHGRGRAEVAHDLLSVYGA